MKVYIGPLVWQEADPETDPVNRPFDMWRPPSGVSDMIDLRNLVAQSTPKTQQGAALYTSHIDIPAPYVKVLDNTHDKLSAISLDAVKDQLQIPEAIKAEYLPELLQCLLGEYADPSVGLLCPPLMPSRKGVLTYQLGDVVVKENCTMAGSRWDSILKELQVQYREAKTYGLDVHQKLLTDWMQKFQVVNYEQFIPQDLPKEPPKPKATTSKDTFNRADQPDLGTSSDGIFWFKQRDPGAGLGRIDIVSNEGSGVCQSANAAYRLEKNLSSADHFAEADFRSDNADARMGPCIRYDAAANTYYLFHQAFTTALNLFKSIASVYTFIAARSVTINLGVYYRQKLFAEGSVLQLFNDGVQAGADVIDSSISGGVRTGLDVFTTLLAGHEVKVDNYNTSDTGAITRFKSYLF